MRIARSSGKKSQKKRSKKLKWFSRPFLVLLTGYSYTAARLSQNYWPDVRHVKTSQSDLISSLSADIDALSATNR
jgi:hypothetical protein